MPRAILEESRLHPAIRAAVAQHHADLVAQVEQAVGRHAVVVVGMSGNPFVRRARRAVQAAGVEHHYLEFGSYFSDWRRRNALKMWTGWPTFPMVFVRGTLIGGAQDLQRLIDGGELSRLLSARG
ncbi:MAG: Glutaredoxin-4 [Pseudomonadota bacterium]|jgi:glutaredoxin-related protein